ncbi:reverse transcriptase family protein [Pseudomonas wadenswilerensis]|uniref:reverse transcriptase family protein n=1 Tax=Pseudomonas wadenswilerensis TaxID=1785161 RepID=UPI00216011FB|nr:reverse transcriptase family protein [Pseudomonas wadenswilerensis]UVM23519.1 reverse transcriptase family protein [Pseudomonas wadenswilerensis]
MAKDKPYYPHAPIGSIAMLAKTLGVHPKLLADLAGKSADSYTHFVVETKGGKLRNVYEPKYELKKLQKRINSRLFEKVQFPHYLQGGVKDEVDPRDYIENSRMHAGSEFLISLDIRDFYDNIPFNSVFSVFKYFFKFPDDVSDLLSRIVTRDGKVPQGACTSSYIANLIFFNSEYSFVSKLRAQGLVYSRLLDDVTVSAKRLLSQDEATAQIKYLAGLFSQHGLRIKRSKTKMERSDDLTAEYAVTGVWVGHGVPKLRRSERDNIRHSVYICECEYKRDCFSEEYHALWNKVSGQVAKLTRLEHAQAKKLRARMRSILPLYDSKTTAAIIREADRLLKRPRSTHTRVSIVDGYRKLINRLGILTRTNKDLARGLRRQLKSKFSDVPSKALMWE